MENTMELDRWELSDGERELILKKSTINRLGFALLFKYFAVFGRFPTSLAEIGADVVQHVAAQLELDARRSDSPQDRTAERYRAEIRAFFGFREATSADAEELATWLRDHAVGENRDREHLTASLEVEYRRRSLEPPVPDRVERIVRAAVHGYEERFCAQVHAKLSPLTRTRLDALLKAADVPVPLDDGQMIEPTGPAV
jgi:hypothetical protein